MKRFMSFSLLAEIPMLSDFHDFLKQIHFGAPNREACYSPHNWKVTYKLSQEFSFPQLCQWPRYLIPGNYSKCEKI